jgi:flagellar biosynthesis/type III secretory pathway protein FliH
VLAQARAQDREAGKAEGLAEGRAEGLAEGRAEGLAEGLIEGRAEGLADGARLATANALLRMLAMRNIAVDDHARAQILGEPTLVRLERWIERSATCTAISELFEDP